MPFSSSPIFSLQNTTRCSSRCRFRHSLSISQTRLLRRPFSTSSTPPPNSPLFHRLAFAWRTTPTKWYPLPISIGIGLLLVLQFKKQHLNTQYPSENERDSMEVFASPGGDTVRLKGPLHIHILGALPLRSMSRFWGYLNSLELPLWFRPFGFKLYAFLFGCNLDEIEPKDLTSYKSLGEFFCRNLSPGSRPICDALLVSPADGRVLHFGTIDDPRRVEQVKGVTYSLDALLGSPCSSSAPFPMQIGLPVFNHTNKDHSIVIDSQFADVNGIKYSLEQLLGGRPSSQESHLMDQVNVNTSDGHQSRPDVPETDASVPPTVLKDALSRDTQVAIATGFQSSPPTELLTSTRDERKRGSILPGLRPGNSLFFAVIYLAPGDYHRFHSPSTWVVERRRHFVGDLFSVSPYVAKRLQNLFVLNERVALLGRWSYGFFAMVPVGATNVGSIKINFDSALRTNVRRANKSAPPPGSYAEASYNGASPLLHGQALRPGEEMGWFCLGSTIILVFEAPKRFEFSVREGEKVKVGQRLGYLSLSEK